jgi:hypothetical protein
MKKLLIVLIGLMLVSTAVLFKYKNKPKKEISFIEEPFVTSIKEEVASKEDSKKVEIIPEKEKKVTQEIVPAPAIMPQPLHINSLSDVNLISDYSLKDFVLKNPDFQNFQILYFEWNGSHDDKMVAEQKDIYKIILYPSPMTGQSFIHRQIFYVPRNLNFVCEVGKSQKK